MIFQIFITNDIPIYRARCYTKIKGVISIYKVNFEAIKYFLAAAKHLNFSKAAEELYVFQPTITKWIKHLEKELDLTLFKRTNRGISLTPSGQCLYERWSLLYKDFEDSIIVARNLDPVAPKAIHIGILHGLDHDKHLIRGIGHFQTLYPNVSFNIQVYDFFEMKAQGNEMDLILTTSLESDYLTEFEQFVTEKMNIYIAMSDQNPLSKKESICLADLKDESFILFSEETLSKASENLIKAYAPLGITPQIVPVNNIPSQRISVKLNQGIAITNHRFHHEDDGIVLKTCSDFSPDIHRILMYNKKSKNKIALTFFEMISGNEI